MKFKSSSVEPPVILTFSTLDPSGCGGLQADIETAASLGCHCAPIATAICTDGWEQNIETLAVDSTIIIEQSRSVLEEMNVKAIKIGFVGSTSNAEAIHSILHDYEDLPVVAHPALCLWDDENPEQADLPDAFRSLILPLTWIANFSLYEAREVAGESDTIDTTAHALVSAGSSFAFITGTGKERREFQNTLFNANGLVRHYHWEQEPPTCHGASSTLATSTAAFLAHGGDETQAIEQAQNFTWQTIRTSRELGFGKRTPYRFFWADQNFDTSQNQIASEMPAAKNTH